MNQSGQQHSRILVLMGTIGALIAGLLPVVLGVIGIWGYARRGYFLSRAGWPIEEGWATWIGLLWYGIVILGGLALIRWSLAFHRRHTIPR